MVAPGRGVSRCIIGGCRASAERLGRLHRWGVGGKIPEQLVTFPASFSISSSPYHLPRTKSFASGSHDVKFLLAFPLPYRKPLWNTGNEDHVTTADCGSPAILEAATISPNFTPTGVMDPNIL